MRTSWWHHQFLEHSCMTDDKCVFKINLESRCIQSNIKTSNGLFKCLLLSWSFWGRHYRFTILLLQWSSPNLHVRNSMNFDSQEKASLMQCDLETDTSQNTSYTVFIKCHSVGKKLVLLGTKRGFTFVVSNTNKDDFRMDGSEIIKNRKVPLRQFLFEAFYVSYRW